MKKIANFACVVLVVIISILTPFSEVSAHEMFSGHTVRFGSLFYNYIYSKYTCDMKVWGTTNFKNSAWGAVYTSALNCWTLYSDNVAYATNYTSISYTNVNFGLADLPEVDGSIVMGMTYDYDDDGDYYITSSGSWNTAFDGIVNLSIIYVNDTYCPSDTTQRRHVLVHEMGHSLGLGHPGSTTISVMHTPIPNVGDWTNIDQPQSHDRSDLNNWY